MGTRRILVTTELIGSPVPGTVALDALGTLKLIGGRGFGSACNSELIKNIRVM